MRKLQVMITVFVAAFILVQGAIASDNLHNNLKAFINQVGAQKGKEIPNYYADILITDAWYIINLDQQNFMLKGQILNKQFKKPIN